MKSVKNGEFRVAVLFRVTNIVLCLILINVINTVPLYIFLKILKKI